MYERLCIKSRVLAAISENRLALIARHMPRPTLTVTQWQRACRKCNRVRQ